MTQGILLVSVPGAVGKPLIAVLSRTALLRGGFDKLKPRACNFLSYRSIAVGGRARTDTARHGSEVRQTVTKTVWRRS